MVDFYNCWEFDNIAWECNRNEGYHITTDSLILEVVNNGKTATIGESREIIVTALNSYVMPFIRYNMGDIAILHDKTCSCSRGLPLLKRIE